MSRLDSAPDISSSLPWEENRAYLTNLAAKHTGNRVDAEDLVQDSYVKGLKLQNTIRPEQHRNYMSRVIKHTHIDDQRRIHSKRHAYRNAVSLAIDPQDARESPSDRLERDEEAEKVRRAVESLEPQYRAIAQRIMNGETWAQIAEAEGIPRGTVGARIRGLHRRFEGVFQPSA